MKVWKIAYDINKYCFLTLDPKSNGYTDAPLEQILQQKFYLYRHEGTPGANILEFGLQIPIIDNAIRNILKDFCGESIRAYPIVVDEAIYKNTEFYYLEMDCIDCVDWDKSKYENGTNTILWIDKYILKKDAVSGKHIFRILGDRLRQVFISDELKERFEAANIKGCYFNLIWDSEYVEEKITIIERIWTDLKRGEIILYPKEQWFPILFDWIERELDRNNHNIDALSKPYQYIYSIIALQNEMLKYGTGGYDAFFYKYGTNTAQLIVDAFKKMGLKLHADMIKNIIRVYNDSCLKREEADSLEEYMEKCRRGPLMLPAQYFLNCMGDLEKDLFHYIEQNKDVYGG